MYYMTKYINPTIFKADSEFCTGSGSLSCTDMDQKSPAMHTTYWPDFISSNLKMSCE